MVRTWDANAKWFPVVGAMVSKGMTIALLPFARTMALAYGERFSTTSENDSTRSTIRPFSKLSERRSSSRIDVLETLPAILATGLPTKIRVFR